MAAPLAGARADYDYLIKLLLIGDGAIAAIADFAEALASKMPGNLKVVYFVNSGSEENELAMLMARLYPGNLGMISLKNAYHGGSSSTIGLTALNTWKDPIPEACIPIMS